MLMFLWRVHVAKWLTITGTREAYRRPFEEFRVIGLETMMPTDLLLSHDAHRHHLRLHLGIGRTTDVNSLPAPLLRREFTLEGKIKQARAYICGLGYYELRLNGQRVGDQVLDPGWTAGSRISSRPVEGPDASSRKSLVIRIKVSARVRIEDEKSATSASDCMDSNRLSDSCSRKPLSSESRCTIFA